MPLKKLSLAIPMCVALTACGTREPPRTVSDVSCTVFARISYAQLPAAQRALPPAQQVDTENKADTDATVAEIQAHNARFTSVCG